MRKHQQSASPKLAPPELHGVVPRQRLFDSLFHSLSAPGAAVTWLSAPPGSGKTTLAASFARALGQPLLWYQVDAGDADPLSFVLGLRRAALAAGLVRAGRLPVPPPDGPADPSVPLRHWFRTAMARLPLPALWVIDNVHEADAERLEPTLRVLFEELPRGPQGLRVLMLGLREPGPACARLVANGVIARLGAGELALNRSECDALVRSRLLADEATLAAVHECSGGWAAGVVLMIEHLRRTDPRAPLADVQVMDSQPAVFDYFAGQVLAQCSAAEQRALMLCAVLPSLDAELARITSQYPHSGALLETLAARHLFVDKRVVAGRTSFQLHRLFRHYLQAQAQQQLSAADRASAAARAALRLEALGEDDSAMALHLAAHDGMRAGALAARRAPVLQAQGRWRTVIDWIGALPPQTVRRDPWLAYWLGAAQVFASPQQAEARLVQAWQGFVETGDRRGQVEALAVLTRAGMLQADWRGLDRWIGHLAALLDAPAPELDTAVRLAGLSRLIYATLARQPQHPGLPAWAEQAAALLEQGGEQGPCGPWVMAGASLLFYFSWTGQTARAREVVRLVGPVAADEQRSHALARVYWLLGQANHLLFAGPPDQALIVIDTALALATANGMSIAGVIRRYRVAHLLTLGRLADAEAELAALQEAPLVEPYLELRAWLALRRGQWTLALQEAQAALREATRRGRSLYAGLDCLLLATICTAAGQRVAAREHLDRYRTSGLALPGHLATLQSLLIEAALGGADPEARQALQGALDIAARHGLRSVWAWDPALMAPLLNRALEQGLQPDVAKDWIRTQGLAAPGGGSAAWPWPVKVHTQGGLTVDIDGVPLRFGHKSPRKPLELLRLLVVAGPGAVAIDELIDGLWPDPEDGGRKAFDITVHRLRKLLGGDSRVAVSGGHAALDLQQVWVDAWAAGGPSSIERKSVGDP